MTKRELAEKIAKEQNLDATKLMRLTVAELEKMDLVVPDEVEETEEEVDEIDIFSDASQEADQADVVAQGSDDVEVEESEQGEEAQSEGKLLGYHPLTGKPVYI